MPITPQDFQRSPPLFSVVTVVLNGVTSIERTIDSVARQTFRNFEYIVLDGGSSDGTVSTILANGHRIDSWSSEPDTGIYNAWNKAVRRIRGQWVCFLGADDQYLSDALERYAECITANPQAQYISSRVQLSTNGVSQRIIGKPWNWKSFSRYMTVAHVGSQHHISMFKDFGCFDESYRICGDYEFLLRPRDRLRTAYVDLVTATMETGGTSNRNAHAAFAETERAKRDTGGRARLLCAIERQEAVYRKLWRTIRGWS